MRYMPSRVFSQKELIYCDQAATSFPKPPRVAEAVNRVLTEQSASPGRSAHRMSLAAARVVFETRETLAELFGARDSSRIAFTSNVTQALNIALMGYLRAGDHVLTTCLEHNSVTRPLAWLAKERGINYEIIPSTEDGIISPADFGPKVTGRTRMAIVNHASNVTGVIVPLKEIKTVLGSVPLLLDVAQTAGAIPIDVEEEYADMVAFTGHKSLLGPTGTGGIWIRPGLEIASFFRGGTGSQSEKEDHPEFMPDRLEAGTQNVHGLAGLSAAVRFIIETGIENIRDRELKLTNRFLSGLRQIKSVTIYGPQDAGSRVALVSMNMAGWSPSDLARVLDEEFGIMTRAGLHCSPWTHRTIGTYPSGAVRFSFGLFNTGEEIDRVLSVLEDLGRRKV